MANALAILEEAISDVGHWSWWTAKLPDAIQLEFRGTQLWNPPLQEGLPPSGQIALRFRNPSFIGFLTLPEAQEQLPDDWPTKLQNDEIQGFSLSSEEFTLTDAKKLPLMVAKAGGVDTILGEIDAINHISAGDAVLSFWAQSVGLVIIAESIGVYNQHGEVSLELVEGMHQQWWEYWKEYWKRRDSSDPLPKDYACEVTWPVTG